MSIRALASERAQALRDSVEELRTYPINTDEYYQRESDLRNAIASLYNIAPREAQAVERELSLTDSLR